MRGTVKLNGCTVILFADYLSESDVADLPKAIKPTIVKEITMDRLNAIMREKCGYEVKIKE